MPTLLHQQHLTFPLLVVFAETKRATVYTGNQRDDTSLHASRGSDLRELRPRLVFVSVIPSTVETVPRLQTQALVRHLRLNGVFLLRSSIVEICEQFAHTLSIQKFSEKICKHVLCVLLEKLDLARQDFVLRPQKDCVNMMSICLTFPNPCLDPIESRVVASM